MAYEYMIPFRRRVSISFADVNSVNGRIFVCSVVVSIDLWPTASRMEESVQWLLVVDGGNITRGVLVNLQRILTVIWPAAPS